MNYKIIGKYINKINFEISNPKIFFLLAENITNYKINIDIKNLEFKPYQKSELLSLQQNIYIYI